MDFKEEFYSRLRQAVIDGLEIVSGVSAKYRARNRMVERHSDWPAFSFIGDTSLPGFQITNFGPRDYSFDCILDHIAPETTTPKSWDDYHSFVYANDKLTRFFKIGEFISEQRKIEGRITDYWKTAYTKWFLPNFIDTYIHLYELRFQEDLFRNLFETYYSFVDSPELKVEVWVPIIFLQFDCDSQEISNGISIERMSSGLQLSRNTRTSFNNTANSVVIGAATHAFRFKNITVKNEHVDSVDNHLNDFGFVSEYREKVNTLLASIRIVAPECEVGYCQFVVVPVGWQSKFKANLLETYVVSERGYPDYFEDYGWIDFGNQFLSKYETSKVQLVYEALTTNEKRFGLAIRRLNRATLNSKNEDAIIDITIALESLLCYETNTEISYRLALRCAILNQIVPFEKYTSKEIFQFSKSLYSLRSTLMHGKSIAANPVVKANESALTLPAVTFGLRYLRAILWTLATNLSIKNPQDIDELVFTSNI